MMILCLTNYGDVSLPFRLKVVEKLEICHNVFWEMPVPFEIIHKLHEAMIIRFDRFPVSRRELFPFIEELFLLLLFPNVKTFHHLSNTFPYFLGCLTTIYRNIYVFRKAQENCNTPKLGLSGILASTQVSPASADVATASFSHDTVCTYIASQSNGSQVKYKDINQIDEDDIEEMDIKWNMALMSMRVDRFWKKTGKKITIQGTDVAGFDKSKVKCFNYYEMGHFARECRAPRSQDWGRRENFKQGSKTEEQTPKAMIVIDEVGWDWSYMANEEEDHALVADQEAPIEFALMAKSSFDTEVFDNSLCSKACKKNTDSINTKISELSEKLSDTKTTLYHSKLGLSHVKARFVEFKNQEIKFCEKIRGLEFKVESKDNRIERFTKEMEELKKEKEGLDSKLTGLPEFTNDTITDYSRPSPSIESNSSDLQNSDSSVFEKGDSSESIMSKPMIKFVKATDSPTKVKISKVETVWKPSVKYAEMYRNTTKSPKVRGNQRNWNNLKTQQLGKDFVMKNKACFKCGQFDHLAYDYAVWEEQGKTWPKNNNTHKSMSPRNVFHKIGRQPMRTNIPNMNVAQPKRTYFTKPAHSYVRRHFQRTSTVRTQCRVPRVSIVNTKLPTVNKNFPIETVTTVNQGMSIKEIKRVVAQRVANAIEAIAIYETKTNLAHKSMSQTEQQEKETALSAVPTSLSFWKALVDKVPVLRVQHQ
nr:hypothetical protein [Tanacetum cinerariifolium]